MQNRTYLFLSGLIAWIGGSVLMSVELIYPRISAIWFGNTLHVWAIDISASLLVIALGYKTGTYLLHKKNHLVYSFLYSAYLVSAFCFALIPFSYAFILDNLLGLSGFMASWLFALIFMLPTMGLLAFTSPVLVQLVSGSTTSRTSASFIYGISSFGGAFTMLWMGLYTLPNLGIRLNCFIMSFLILIPILLLYYLKKLKI